MTVAHLIPGVVRGKRQQELQQYDHCLLQMAVNAIMLQFILHNFTCRKYSQNNVDRTLLVFFIQRFGVF